MTAYVPTENQARWLARVNRDRVLSGQPVLAAVVDKRPEYNQAVAVHCPFCALLHIHSRCVADEINAPCLAPIKSYPEIATPPQRRYVIADPFSVVAG